MYISVAFIMRLVGVLGLVVSPALCYLYSFRNVDGFLASIMAAFALLGIGQILANQERIEANTLKLNDNFIKLGKLVQGTTEKK